MTQAGMKEMQERHAAGWLVRYEFASAPAGARASAGCIALLPRGVRIEQPAGSVVLDFAEDTRLQADAASKTFSRAPGALRAAEALLGRGGIALQRCGGTRRMTLGKRELQAHRYEADSPGGVLEVWATRDVTVAPRSGAVLWALLGLRAPDATAVPVDMVLRTRHDLARILRSWRATAIDAAGEKDLHADLSGHEQRPAIVNHRGQASKTAKPDPLKSGSRLRQNLQPAATDDFAFIARQPALDTLRGAINRLTRPLGTFIGMHTDAPAPGDAQTGIHLNLPALTRIEGALLPERELETRALKRLMLYGPIAQGSDLPDLSAGQAARYQWLLEHAPDYLDQAFGSVELARLMIVAGMVDPPVPREQAWEEAELESLANAAFERLRTGIEGAPFVHRDEGGAPVRAISEADTGQGFGYNAYKFDLLVNFGAGGVLGQLHLLNDAIAIDRPFPDNAIRLQLTIPRIQADFEFETWPIEEENDNDTGDDRGLFAALGVLKEASVDLLAAAVFLNYGWGTFLCENAEVELQLSPLLRPDGKLAFAVHLVLPAPGQSTAGATRLNASITLKGLNLLQSIAVNVADVLLRVSEQQALAALDQGIRDFMEEPPGLLPWPASWHAQRAPAPGAVRACVERYGLVLAGSLAHPPVDVLRPAAPVDPEAVESLGYAFSARYLTAWVRERVPDAGEYKLVDAAALEALTGVTLPDPPPQGRPPEPGSAALLPRYRERQRGDLAIVADHPLLALKPVKALVFRRTAPTVVLPAEGPATSPGAVEVGYEIEIAHVVRGWRRQPVVTGARDRERPPGDDRIPGIGPDLPGGLGTDRPYEEWQPGGGSALPEGGFNVEEKWQWHEETLEPFLVARLRAHAQLQLGFHGPMGELALPEIACGVASKGLLPAEPAYSLDLEDLQFTQPFEERHRATLESYVRGLCEQSAGDLMKPLVRDGLATPGILREWLPAMLWNIILGPDAPDDTVMRLRNLLVLRPTGQQAEPRYLVRGGRLYWSFEASEGLGAVLA